MGRLKKDHSGYNTSGLWLKYKSPAVEEKPLKIRAKKDTKKWCKGKVGRPHLFRRIEEQDKMIFSWYSKKCVNCGKNDY